MTCPSAGDSRSIPWTIFIEHLLCAMHCAELFTCMGTQSPWKVGTVIPILQMRPLRPRKGMSQNLVVGPQVCLLLSFALSYWAGLLSGGRVQGCHGALGPDCSCVDAHLWSRRAVELYIKSQPTGAPALPPQTPPTPASSPGRRWVSALGRPRHGGSAPSAGHCAENRTEMGPALRSPGRGSRVLASDGTHFIDPKNSTVFCFHVEPGAGFGPSVSGSRVPRCDPQATVLKLFWSLDPFMLLKITEDLQAPFFTWVVSMSIFCIRNENGYLKIVIY